jgi:hypothetical protein
MTDPLHPLRIVLFGMPHAGKSSLLGAAVQAARTQERDFAGRLVELPPALDALARQTYDGPPQSTEAEVVPYPVTFEPLDGPKPDPARRSRVELVDCDGRVANELLTRPRDLGEAAEAGELARSVLAADAVVLVTDASAPPDQADADFAEFARFLHLLERHRGRQAAVAGLPVFLALTKCDLLAHPGDTPAQWRARIGERRGLAEARLRAFLDREDPGDEAPAFGAVDVRTAPTAIRRPALAGSPGQPREPFGVAELFRDCLTAAGAFRARAAVAHRRLWLTLTATAGMLVVMAVVAVALVGLRGLGRRVPLAGKVENYQAREGATASVRLREPVLPRLSELTELRADPEFPLLPPELQAYVVTRLEELQAYDAFQRKLATVRPPADARSTADLDETEKRLKTELDPPAKYADDWSRTEAVQLRNKWLADAAALRDAVGRAVAWYDGLKQDGDKLLFPDKPAGAPVAWADWLAELAKLQARAGSPPFDPARPLAGSRPVGVWPAVDGSAALAFRAVRQAREAWERVEGRLTRLRDVATAFGLAGGAAGERAPLRVPAPPAFKASLAGARLAALRQTYPHAAGWGLGELPEAVQPEVRAAAEASRRHLMDAGQEVVLARLQLLAADGRETPERWRELAGWLPSAAELREWRDLTVFVSRFLDPQAADPVTALAAFLLRTSFDLETVRLTVRVPDALLDQARPDGPLTLYHQPAGGQPVRAAFKPDGPGEHDARAGVTTYRLSAEAATRFAFKPGDGFWAEWPAKGRGGAAQMLTWSVCRSQVYQFERLSRTPRLHRRDEAATAGGLVDGVTVTASPAWPEVPELLPVVRLEGR